MKYSNQECSCRAAVLLHGRCLFFDCGYVYGFLSFVDVFNEYLVTVSGAASCFTSLDQRAVVLKGGLPKTTCCPKRDSLTGTDCSSYEVPAAALLLLEDEQRWAWECSQE